jgi:RNA polymerase sigma-70 factor (ECF subfamily)
LNLSGPLADQKGEGAPELEGRMVEIFDELRIPVSRYLRRIGLNAEDSEEIVQEAFLRLFKHLLEEGQEDNLRSWVYRVAHNLAIDQYKQRRCATKSPQEWAGLSDLLIDKAPSPEELLISKEKIARVNRAISSLSSRQAQLLYLRMEGLRYREIGETLRMKISTVAASLRLAIEKLREDENNPQ